MSESPGVQSRNEHSRRTGLIQWILVQGDRVVVSAVLLLGLFTILCALDLSGFTAVRNTDPLFYLFSAFIGGNLTLITIVISINQLVLARQLDTPGELRTRLRNTAEFRRAAAASTDRSVMPILPPSFMQVLVTALERDSRILADSVSGITDDEFRTELRSLTTGLDGDLTRITDFLEESGTSPFHALSATLDANIAQRLQRAEYLQSRLPNARSEEIHESLDDLVNHLELLDISREYFKTLFMQMELSYLTRALLYVGIPAELSATVALLGLGLAPGPTAPWILQFPVTPAIITLSFAPLAVLLVFVLRITLVTERTIPITPFATPEQVT